MSVSFLPSSFFPPLFPTFCCAHADVRSVSPWIESISHIIGAITDFTLRMFTSLAILRTFIFLSSAVGVPEVVLAPPLPTELASWSATPGSQGSKV